MPCGVGGCQSDGQCGAGLCMGGSAKVFTAIYAANGNHHATAVVQLAAGGFAIAGHTTAVGGQQQDMVLARYDGSGVPVWQKTYGSGGKTLVNDLIAAPAGFVLVGQKVSSAGDLDGAIVVTSDDGWPLGLKSVGGKGDDALRSAVAISPGELVIAGWSDPASGGREGWLLHTDGAGNQSSSKYFGGGSQQRFAALATAGQKLALAGTRTPLGQADEDGWVVVTSLKGAQQWQRVLAAPGDNTLVAIAMVDGDEVLAAGRTAGKADAWDTWLIRLDASGATRWSRTIDSGGVEVVQAMVASAEGEGWVMGARVLGEGAASDAWAMRFDVWGNPLASRTYAGGASQRFFDGVRVPGGGVAMTGQSVSSGPTGVDILLVRTDRWGNGTCVQAGACVDKAAPDCDDGSECSVDDCQKSVCSHATLPPASPCGPSNGPSAQCLGLICAP